MTKFCDALCLHWAHRDGYIWNVALVTVVAAVPILRTVMFRNLGSPGGAGRSTMPTYAVTCSLGPEVTFT